MKFERFAFEGNTLDTVDKFDDYATSLWDDNEKRDCFKKAVKNYIYDCIELIAAARKSHPNESPFSLGEDNDWEFSDYLYNLMDYTDFIYDEEFDRETCEYDLEDGWETAYKIFRNPTNAKLYGLPITYSPWHGNDWSVDDFFYAYAESKVVQTYKLDFGKEE